MAGDLNGRLDVIRFEANSEVRIRTLVHEGSEVFNVDLPEAEIAKAAVGSFNLAQLICQSACIQSNFRERPETRRSLTKSLSTVLETVMDDLSLKFMELCMKFATGPRFSREGRAPYLHILQWLSEKAEWTLNLDREIRYRPELRGSVSQVIDRGHLSDFLEKNPDLSEVLHYDSKTHVLAVEDPRFFFFIKNLQWAKFAERVGYLNIGFTTRYDFALSFAGADRAVAELIYERLNDREFSVFYDKNEQDRILAADVEEYLAPIYQTEAAFVLCLLSKHYPGRIWTKFESRQFRSRFGSESVVPIWFPDSLPSTFDVAGGFGGHVIDLSAGLEEEVERIVDTLQARLAEYRLQPKIEPGQFLCRRCRLILPMTLLAEGRVSMCTDCGEQSKIY